MSHAVDLPEGSVVANAYDCCLKRYPAAPYPWRTTALRRAVSNATVEAMLADGAMVLRYGYELEGRPDAGEPVRTADVDGYPVGHRLVLPDALVDPS